MEIVNKQQASEARDDDDRAFLIRQQGFEEGLKHQSPSPETREALKQMGEDINKLNIGQTKLEGKIDLLLKISNDNSEVLKNHILEEEKYRDKQDSAHEKIMQEKANVWVEKVLIWAGSIIGGAILLALMSLILIKKI